VDKSVRLSNEEQTWATNIEVILSLSRYVVAMWGVGDLEAIAASIPSSLSALKMPLECGNKEGVSCLERHSLKV